MGRCSLVYTAGLLNYDGNDACNDNVDNSGCADWWNRQCQVLQDTRSGIEWCNGYELRKMHRKDDLALQRPRLDSESTPAPLHLHRVAGRSVQSVCAGEESSPTGFSGHLAVAGWSRDNACRSIG